MEKRRIDYFEDADWKNFLLFLEKYPDRKIINKRINDLKIEFKLHQGEIEIFFGEDSVAYISERNGEIFVKSFVPKDSELNNDIIRGSCQTFILRLKSSFYGVKDKEEYKQFRERLGITFQNLQNCTEERINHFQKLNKMKIPLSYLFSSVELKYKCGIDKKIRNKILKELSYIMDIKVDKNSLLIK